MKKHSIRLGPQFINSLLVLSVILISFVVVIGLFVGNLINWTWITGWAIGAIVICCAWFALAKSTKMLFILENHFLYYFFFVLRTGLYFIPFLIAYEANSIFSIFGVIIGYAPFVVFPFISFVITKNIKIEMKTSDQFQELN
ncbi:MG406 family protein [Spiroplasma endosymbiont of Labia minor]|uniref:MG406 family protein n=1 Tax=Spiroplasma endosymbiont of Labia minor TaxID=3066305 RepID=UPI0030D06C4A